MRFLKWAALVLVALAIIAAVVLQWRRDTIALEIANRVLRDTDFAVASIAVSTLGVDRVVLSSIVLETPDGTRYEVAGLDYPLQAPTAGPRRIGIDDLTVTWPEERATSSSYTDLVRTLLALPDTLPDTDVQVRRVSIQALPLLSGISWATSGTEQALSADVAGLTVNAGVTRLADDNHEVQVAALDAGAASVLRGLLSLTGEEQRVAIKGSLYAELAGLMPLLRALDWVPTPVQNVAATLDGLVAVDLDADGDGSLAVRYEPLLSTGSALTWRDEDGMQVGATLGAPTRADVALSYPSLAWTLAAQTLPVTLLFDDGSEIAVTLSAVQCRSGIQCTLRGTARAGPMAWGGIEVKTIDVREATGIMLSAESSGWSAAVERLDVAVEELRAANTLFASLRFTVSDLELADELATIRASFRSSPGAGRLQYGDVELAVPGLQATITRAGDALTSSLRLFDKAGSLDASIGARYDMATRRGAVTMRDAVVDFGRRKLSQRLVGWSYPWDVIGGQWTVTADLDWGTATGGLQFRSRSTHALAGLAGYYGDIGLAGLATTLQVDVSDTGDLRVHPATVRIDLVDVGVPISNVSADVVLDVAGLVAEVQALSGAVLGGRFTVDPFAYSPLAERHDLQVRLERIQPQFIVDLVELEKLEITGTMSGMLPVALIHNTVGIAGGRLSNDPPGGVIRYQGSGAPVGAAANAQLAVVTGALSNFAYESLTARVDYTEAGDLELGIRLQGINPDRDPTQPIILNLNVEDNIPQLLRSLQAVRSIEDIIERRATN